MVKGVQSKTRKPDDNRPGFAMKTKISDLGNRSPAARDSLFSRRFHIGEVNSSSVPLQHNPDSSLRAGIRQS